MFVYKTNSKGNKLSKYLYGGNVATRKNIGTDKGIKLLKKYIEENKKYGEFYFLKLDIKKYFYNINHAVLKKLIQPDLNDSEFALVSKIIDSTNREYVNKNILKLSEKHPDLPLYKSGKGLPIGNMSSQFLAIFYLSKLYHFIVHDLHIKHLIVYMDDYILIHPDKNYLKNALNKIENKLKYEYKLELNKKKTQIKSSKEGVTFLGYHFKVKSKKTYITLTSNVKKRIRDGIKKNKYLINHENVDFNRVFSSINTYKHSYKYTSSKYIENILDKYWYN